MPGYPARALKDRSIAIILEVLPGLFGFLGFGWIYAGETGKGITYLIGYWTWLFIGGIITAFTVGLGCIIVFPLSVAFIAVSASSLSKYARQRPDMFGP
jgi:hypothetical protein